MTLEWVDVARPRSSAGMTAVLAALALLGPIVVHDAQERSPLGSVGPRAGSVTREPVVYRRVADGWVQFWMVYASNDQDRGVLHTGRHAGDWEMVQFRLDGSEAVYAQHSGAERCGAGAVQTRGGRPVIFVASGSHAAYFRAGVRDRKWPDPNDEARGDGAVVVPRVAPLGDWVRWPGIWPAHHGARAGWVPGEMDSPRGPAFQPQGRWSDPEGWARRARPCTFDRCDEVGECDTRESLMGVAAPVAALLLLAGWARRRSSRDAEHPEP